MPISIEEVETKGACAQGLSVQWDDGQFVVIVRPKGVVGCAAIDVSVMEEFDMAVAVAHGTPENPLVVPDDLLAATISSVTARTAVPRPARAITSRITDRIGKKRVKALSKIPAQRRCSAWARSWMASN